MRTGREYPLPALPVPGPLSLAGPELWDDISLKVSQLAPPDRRTNIADHFWPFFLYF